MKIGGDMCETLSTHMVRRKSIIVGTIITIRYIAYTYTRTRIIGVAVIIYRFYSLL